MRVRRRVWRATSLRGALILLAALVAMLAILMFMRLLDDDDNRIAELLADASGGVAGQRLAHLPVGEMVLERSVVVPRGVTLVGSQTTLTYTGKGAAVVLASRSAVENVTVRLDGPARAGIEFEPEAQHVKVAGCSIVGDGDGTGVWAKHGVKALTVDGCTFRALDHGIRLEGQASDVVIEDSAVTEWTRRGIRIQGDARGSSKGLQIRDVTIGPNVGHGPSRYPLVALSTGESHRDIVVERVSVEGSDHAHDDASSPGTADQISINDTVGVTIRACVSVNGGERGINVMGVRDALVEDNEVRGSDTVGIGVGRGRPGKPVIGAVVRGNTVVDSGQNRVGTTVEPSLAGIRVSHARDVQIVGNNITSTTANQLYGVTLDSTADAEMEGNTITGTLVASVFNNSASGTVNREARE